ncbi:MAG: hypothetical protein NWF06_10280 [Candidatus Bathyarchaeota archaeon]|nr:hypothetical protein [Candidatus Bathyarchaeum sp.]
MKVLLRCALLAVCLVVVCFPEGCSVNAQSSTMWQQTYGGAEVDASTSLVQTSDGGYALLGFTRSFGEGEADAWLIKTDEQGTMQWNKTYGGTKEEGALCLIQTADGGFAFVGHTESFATEKADDLWTAVSDIWLVKTDENGNMQWNKTYGGEKAEYGSCLVQTDDDGFALTGHSEGELWLIKTDSYGEVEWNQTHGGQESKSNPYGLIQTLDGGFAFVAGTYPDDDVFVDFLFVKTDEQGNMQWNQTYGGERMDYGTSLLQTLDGEFVLAGCTDSFGAGGYDFWLIKTDNSGNALWNQTYGNENQDTNPSLAQTADGGFALAGYTHPDLADLLLVKTDNLGNMEWNQTYQGQAVSGLPSLIQTTDGGFALAGTKGFWSASTDDFWLIKTDEYGVVPEFPSWTILPLLVTATVAAVIWKHKLHKNAKQQAY